MKSSKPKTATFALGVENSDSASKKASTLSSGVYKTRKRSSVKGINENESMILAPPPVAESMLKHAISIPSENSENILDDEQIVKQVTKRLKEISASLEKTYGLDVKEELSVEKIPSPEGGEKPLTEAEDMTSFLLFCTSLAKQLEEAVKEEQQILESLFKWFQREVYHVEELVKEQNVSDWELPLPDKAVSSSINQVIDLLQKLEKLRNRFCTVPIATRRAVAAKHKQDSQSETTQIYQEVMKMIEDYGANFENDEFIETIKNIVDNVFLSESTESVYLQFQEMFKIVEKQATKLQRVMNDLESLEVKYKMTQNDFDIVTEEKIILENELKKIKGPEKIEQLLQREKILLELQRKKSEKVTSRDSLRNGDLDSFSKRSSIILTSADAAKLKEELLQAQVKDQPNKENSGKNLVSNNVRERPLYDFYRTICFLNFIEMDRGILELLGGVIIKKVFVHVLWASLGSSIHSPLPPSLQVKTEICHMF
ncbi:coiled-coil domain-containing protein 7 isoform X2 [Sarcophilus harrisii]|uniref:coiled-coil domain-containing protein 7 isoform X2 n=1 Tax=Sarcophilus harrisii TaxID=9305 RepID=UPI001301BF9C|nr:coiled-coil domain-containing protein 7 isoform X2 [Sarcophilus harrisii]